MKISIITVCYNSEKTIERTVRSVISQDYDDFEYIIIDGASKDKTLEICNKYREKITHLLSEKDEGIYDAMNKGISLASGDVIAILNSDDYFINNQCLKKVKNSFSEDVDIIFGNVLIFSEKNKKIKRKYKSSIYKPYLSVFGIQPPHPASFIRKKTYDTFGTYDKNYRIAGDFDLLTRFTTKEKVKYKIIDEDFVMMSDGGISNANLKTRNKTTQEIKDSLRKNGLISNKLFINLRYLIKLTQLL